MRKKIIALALSIGVAGAIILDVFYVFFFKADQSNLTTNSTSSTRQKNESTTTSSVEKESAENTATAYVDGKYTGLSTATSWGQLQLRIEIENGKLVEIDVLEYPDDNARDIQINEQALPLYKPRVVTLQPFLAPPKHIKALLVHYKML